MPYDEVASIITDIWNVEKYSSYELPDADTTTSLFQRAEAILIADSRTGI